MSREQFSIGALSKRCGVSVKTIRFYSEAGLLEPSARSDAGYRLYTREDSARLDTIRSLRALGFPVAAIKSMLADAREARELAQMHLEIVETQLRALRRESAIVRAAIATGDREKILDALHLANAAASLGSSERKAKVDAFMRRAGGDASDAAAVQLRASVLDGLPEELSPDQLEAWIELHALIEDGALLSTIARQHEPFDERPMDEPARVAFVQEMHAITAEARAVFDRGADASEPDVERVARRWSAAIAAALGRAYDAAFLEWFLGYAQSINDPRIERFWQLVSKLHGRPEVPQFTRAFALLIESLRSTSFDTSG